MSKQCCDWGCGKKLVEGPVPVVISGIDDIIREELSFQLETTYDQLCKVIILHDRGKHYWS